MRRILLVRTDRVGDVVMTTAAIREIRRNYPDAFIAALTKPHTSNVLLNNPNLNLIITDDPQKNGFWEIVKKIRSYKFTDALLIMPTERAAYQLFFAGIRNRVGVGHKLYEVITFMKSVVRNNYTPLRHESDYCMDLARKIGVKGKSIQPEIFLTEAEKKEAGRFFKDKGIPAKSKLIFIHTGTFGSAPNWSEDKYLQLIQKILGSYKDANIILTAREMSGGFRDDIKRFNSERVLDVSYDTENLRDLIKLIYKADIMICTSTGPLHIADALNVKCIGLYCNRPMSSAKRWGVVNKHSINLQISGDYCSANCSADQNTCAFENGIGIDSVIKSINLLLNK